MGCGLSGSHVKMGGPCPLRLPWGNMRGTRQALSKRTPRGGTNRVHHVAWDQVLPRELGALNKLRVVRCLQRGLVQILVHSRCVFVKSSKIDGTSKGQTLRCRLAKPLPSWRWVTAGLRIQLPKADLDLPRAQ